MTVCYKVQSGLVFTWVVDHDKLFKMFTAMEIKEFLHMFSWLEGFYSGSLMEATEETHGILCNVNSCSFNCLNCLNIDGSVKMSLSFLIRNIDTYIIYFFVHRVSLLGERQDALSLSAKVLEGLTCSTACPFRLRDSERVWRESDVRLPPQHSSFIALLPRTSHY